MGAIAAGSKASQSSRGRSYRGQNPTRFSEEASNSCNGSSGADLESRGPEGSSIERPKKEGQHQQECGKLILCTEHVGIVEGTI
mmetsp:Transcript_150519/g.273953  ORF Transcript_150519/g.273953 Transcript_150519/m.273953 type:complete len:84 (-) Transcript_150519:22-273(-)